MTGAGMKPIGGNNTIIIITEPGFYAPIVIITYFWPTRVRNLQVRSE